MWQYFFLYHEAVGAIMYLIRTKSDLVYAVSVSLKLDKSNKNWIKVK